MNSFWIVVLSVVTTYLACRASGDWSWWYVR